MRVKRSLSPTAGTSAVDRAGKRSAQNALWRFGSGGAKVAGARLARALVGDEFEVDLLAFVQVVHPGALNGADMDEHVRAAVVRLDETKALLGIEPLYGSDWHSSASFCAFRAIVRRPERRPLLRNIDVQGRCRGPAALFPDGAGQVSRPKLDGA